MKAPFPYFGGKSIVASQVWELFGDLGHYIEPFFGSGAVLLARPEYKGTETVNDLDGMVANFWRAASHDPESVAVHADNPVNEADLHARHLWLNGQREHLTLRLMADPDYYDAKVAGWWLWGVNAWIGSGWCSGEGPWHNVDGVFNKSGNAGKGVNRKLPHLGDAGKGVNRKLPHLGDAGQGVNRQLPHLGNAGQGVNRQHSESTRGDYILDLMTQIKTRMRDTRVACGDWTRVTGNSVITATGGVTGIFLDPPYSPKGRSSVYTEEHDLHDDMESFCLLNGGNPKLKIILCGYEGEYPLLTSDFGWNKVRWKANGGFGSQAKGTGRGEANAHKETMWLSPHIVLPA